MLDKPWRNMKRRPVAGVVTMFDMQNFGNRLQNYAVHRMLERLGCDVKTVEVSQNRLRTVVRDLAYRLGIKDYRGGRGRRFRRFFEFSKSFTPRLTVNPRKNLAKDSRFDFYFIGSDQVWNPNESRIGGKESGLPFLSGVETGRKATISPSFGLTEIPRPLQSRYAEWLNSFASLTVREDAGADIVERLTARRPTVLADPTIGIQADEWRSLASYSANPSHKYSVRLFLGDGDPDRSSIVSRVLDETFPVAIDLEKSTTEGSRDIGPKEFLGLIDGASVVVTDSFHCAIFAFLLDTRLIIVPRTGAGAAMSSRIDTLTRTFNLTDRVWDGNTEAHLRSLLEVHDYSRGESARINQRNAILEHLRNEVQRMTGANR